MPSIVCEGLKDFQSFMEVFIGGVILDHLEEEGSENPQTITLKTTTIEPFQHFPAAVEKPRGISGPRTPEMLVLLLEAP